MIDPTIAIWLTLALMFLLLAIQGWREWHRTPALAQ